jgi:hypothetical protein
MKLKRLANVLVNNGTANTGSAGVSPTSSNKFAQHPVESRDGVALHECGRDARGPSICGPGIRGLRWLAGAVAACLLLFPLEALARVGGGQSYGGGGGHGGSGGGSGGAIIGLVRVLVWLTVEYPAVGVPVDICVVGFVVYRFARRGKKGSEAFSSSPI